MRERLLSVRVTTPADLQRIEDRLVELCGGKDRKCALLRTKSYIQLRLCALYGRGQPPMSVYYQNYQVRLDPERNVSIFLLEMEVLPEEAEQARTRKRAWSDSDDETGPPCRV